MADEDITLDGKPLQSLRVADLKAALEQRKLSKSGQKNALIKRLKGALMLENLQKSSSSHIGLQPNSQIGEEMSQNSFIKQYLAKQQELLCQRLEREAQQAAEADESPAAPDDDEDHPEGNDSSSYFSDKHRPLPSQEGGSQLTGQGAAAYRPDMGLRHQENPEAPGAWTQRSSLQLGREDPPAPSPPRAVASLSVRVVGQPDLQGLPPVVSRAHEKEGAAPAEPGGAHPVLHLSRSAGGAAGAHIQEDSDEDEDDGNEESDEDEEWGAGHRPSRLVPVPRQPSPSPNVPAASARSRRKLQPPQHIPPPQVHQPPMQLRHPTPPPSPPPELSFPLPDTPKQSPPDVDEQEGEGPRAAAPRMAARAAQHDDSDSSSGSSSPEPLQQRRPGPLSLLARKMESERTPMAGVTPEALDMSAGTMRPHSAAAVPATSARATSSSETPLKRIERGRLGEQRRPEEEEEEEEEDNEEDEEEEERVQKKKAEGARAKNREVEEKMGREEEKKICEKEESAKRKEHVEEEEEKREQSHLEKGKEKKPRAEERESESHLPPWKRGRNATAAAQASQESAMDLGAAPSPQSSKRSVLVRDASPQQPLSPPAKSAASTIPSPTAKRPRMFSDTSAGSTAAPAAKAQSRSVVVTEARDLGSSSDSGSDSSPRSSRSSSSPCDKSRPAKKLKKEDLGSKAEDEKKTKVGKSDERRFPPKRYQYNET